MNKLPFTQFSSISKSYLCKIREVVGGLERHKEKLLQLLCYQREEFQHRKTLSILFFFTSDLSVSANSLALSTVYLVIIFTILVLTAISSGCITLKDWALFAINKIA